MKHPRPLSTSPRTPAITLMMFLLAALPSCQPAAPQAKADVIVSPPKSSKPRNLTAREFQDRLERGDRFIVLLTHPSCRISPKIKERIEASDFDWRALYYVSEESEEDTALLATHLPFTGSWPALFAIDKGRTIDAIIGPNNLDVVERFVERNLFDRTRPLEPFDATKHISAKQLFVRTNYNTPTNLEGADLSNIELRGRSFSGFDLQRVDFSDSTLERISFSQADLTEANFEGATLSDIFWGDTICPDGTPSREQGYTCAPAGASTPTPRAPEPPPEEEGYVTRKPEIRVTDDGTIYREDFLVGTAWMFGRKRKTVYRTPVLLEKEQGYALITKSSKVIARDTEESPESFDYYLFQNREDDQSFILTLPSNKARVRPEDASMYRL